MNDPEPQTADGKVLWHFTVSVDGFVAGPEHAMDWMTGLSARPRLIEEYIETTGAVLAGRSGFDSAIGDARPYGGAWQGAVFVLTHHPEDAGKNVEVFSPDIGRQLLERGLIDEIDLHIAPILLGEGIRRYDNPGGVPIRLHRIGDGEPTSVANVRYRPYGRQR